MPAILTLQKIHANVRSLGRYTKPNLVLVVKKSGISAISPFICRETFFMKHTPNLLTAINLALGSAASLLFLENQYLPALICFLLALVMDTLDGLAARLLNAYSELGKQLDSLADLISFGVLPGFVWYALLEQSSMPELRWIGLLYIIAAAFRLAKFNIDERQSIDFLGLPTPSGAMFTIGYFFWVEVDAFGFSQILQSAVPVLLFLMLISTLMVTEIPMFSLKVTQWTWKGNEIKFIFVLSAIPLLIIMKIAALPLLILIYILISLVKWLF